LLVLVVLLLHGWIASEVADSAFDFGASQNPPGPARLKAVFVADLRPTEPPAQAPRVVAPIRRKPRPQPAPQPASAPAAPASAPASAPVADLPPPPEAVPDATVAAAPEPPPPASAPPASVPAAADPVPPPAAASAASAAPPFEWPRSTRLSYRLTGYFRGPVEGQASVEWLHEGQRYQVHLEVSVGPSFAPLVSRRMSSDGVVGPEGLTPLRYDEETRVALRDPRRIAVLFDGPVVRLANGSERPRPAGVQDTASQFVQLTWLFTTQPDRLRPGQSVDLMLALPRRIDRWTYDVLARETLYTPVGAIDAVHVRPRRPERPDGELTAEVWIAPTLRYLPVRIVIRQDAETHVDLLLERLPQQTAEPEPPR
jgi:hypothetical protein